MKKEDFLKSGLLEQYVLKLTTAEETAQVEDLLRRYPEVKQELDAMQNAIEQYALSLSIPPPPHVKKKVIAEIDNLEGRDIPPTPAVSRNRSWPMVSRWAAVLALLVISSLFWMQNQRLKQDYFDMRSNLQGQLTACQEQAQRAQDRPFAFLGEPATNTVILKGTPLTPEAEAIVFWNPEKKSACLNTVNLPDPPSGKQYQIWADVNGKMIDMGLIESANEQLQLVDFIAQAESFNITLEPLGGSEHPTVSLLQANGYVSRG